MSLSLLLLDSQIRRIVTATGDVSTIAGCSGCTPDNHGTRPALRVSFFYPFGIAYVSADIGLYVTDGSRNDVFRLAKSVTSPGEYEVTYLLGQSFLSVYRGESVDGYADTAQFSSPCAVAAAPAANLLYVADCGAATIRTVSRVGRSSSIFLRCCWRTCVVDLVADASDSLPRRST